MGYLDPATMAQVVPTAVQGMVSVTQLIEAPPLVLLRIFVTAMVVITGLLVRMLWELIIHLIPSATFKVLHS
jgi:hypothetical protein